MPLVQPNSGVSAPVAQNVSAADDKKAKFAEFKAKQKAKIQEKFQKSVALRDELVKLAIFDKLTDGSKALITELTKDPSVKTRAAGGPSVFNTVFGASPQVGQKITLEDAFRKTAKGLQTLKIYLKRWKEEGNEVELKEDATDIFKSTFTIIKLA